MALTQRLSNLAANAEINAHVTLLDGGWLDIYDGTQPASPESPPPADAHKLASLRFGSPAFGAGMAGLAAANAITSDPDAARTGTATWYRLCQADHVTAVEDGSVGTSGANLNLNSTAIQQHAEVAVDAFSLGVSKA